MFVTAPAVVLGLRLIVEGSCPSAAAVAACLTPLLPPSLSVNRSTDSAATEPSATEFRASVEPLDELLRVQVRDASGRLLSHNDLPRSATCDGLAAAAAIVIFTAVTAQPRVSPPILAIPPQALPPPPAPPPPPRVTLALSVAGLLALGAGSATAGGLIDVGLATPTDTWGGRLLVAALGVRPISVGQGAAEWSRLPVSLLARRRIPAAPYRLVVDVSAGVFGAVVFARGTSLAENYRSLDVDVGLGGGFRLGRSIDLPSGRLLPTLELLAVGWLRPQNLRLQDEPQPVVSLPAWDILLSLGLGWQRALP
ncbi:MAG TPA: hypothetical protein PKI03_18755 [Pseudomonadota bacterium]|nr:hypothetical protein [Pseudomonadota bacterium]